MNCREQRIMVFNSKGKALIIILLLAFQGSLFAQGMSFPSDHKHPIEPAFEKIYVQGCQLVTMPDGLYYFDDNGGSTKVKTVLFDEDGMYVIVINYQCPLCGRTYANKVPDDEYGCPIFMRQVHPKVWSE